MDASTSQSRETPEEDFTHTWRYKAGLGLFVIGNAGLIIGILLPLLGHASGGKAELVGLLIIGGELITLSSIVFLGKAGFLVLKKRLFGFVKAGYVAHVGRMRHYIGIALFLVCMLTTYTTALYAWTAFGTATLENPMPDVWGLEFAEQGQMVIWLFLIGEISLLISIYVLGADWWGRLRDIVVWKEPDVQLGSADSISPAGQRKHPA